MTDKINYESMIDRAMRGVVAASLEVIAQSGIDDDRSLYISFNTNAHGVQLGEVMRKSYPEEITIVLQHQFENLTVEKEKFSVTLRFNGIAEEVIVPFAAITAFADPSAKFVLEFDASVSSSTESVPEAMSEAISAVDSSNVIALDRFRDKR
jgi:hypothetical protein